MEEYALKTEQPPAERDMTPEERVAARFRSANLAEKPTRILHDLALEKELAGSSFTTFGADMELPPLPDLRERMRLRSGVSLLPLETIHHKIKLPSIPGTVVRLQAALERETSSNELAEIISSDPKLTAAVMSLVNSPLYSLPMPVETLSRAVTVIGTREVSSLALGARILSMFDEMAPEKFPIKAFWKHSITCAALANDLATLCGKTDPEKYLVAGLLHDLGRVMLGSFHPDLFLASLALSRSNSISLHEAELRLFDVDHSMVGAVFFKEWRLPQSFVQSALHHHTPDLCFGKEVPEVVYVANQLATALGLGCNDVYDMEPAEEIWEKLNLTEEKLRTMLANEGPRLWSLFCCLFPDASECRMR